MSNVDIRRAGDRATTRTAWLDSKHSFSFGRQHDPANVGHGQLIVLNDDRVAAGMGFETHPHRDMEIVTWVLSGELEHKDSVGNRGLIYPGLAQRMSAGSGIWHSEKNLRSDQHVHFIQMWVVPDTESIDPGYQQEDVNDLLAKGGLVPVASGAETDAAISLAQRDATLWVGRLTPGETLPLPDGGHVHLFIAKGDAELESAGPLTEGDAARLTAVGDPTLAAGSQGAEVLVWATA